MSHKKDKKGRAEITEIHGQGNSDGGSIGGSGKITYDVNDKTQVYIQGNIHHNQPFNGQPSQTSGGGSIGIGIGF